MARLSKILGPDGRPVDLDALFDKAKAGPTLTGVRSPISGHPADGLTPARLARIHRAAAQGDILAYLELAEDIEERDLHYAAVLGTRKRQVSQIPVTVEAASDDPEHIKHADFVRDWLSEGVLDAALFDLCDAIGKGFSVLEIEWEATPERPATPTALTWRDPRWFTVDELSLDEIMLYEGIGKEPLAPHKFIVHRHKSKSGLTIRSGLARVASWAWMYKAFTLRDWALFCQNYGMPIRVGRYGAGATDEDKEILWSAVANVAGDCAAIVPDSMKIEFIELKNAADGSKLYEARASWMDAQISKLVLGQTATTDASPGSHAAGRTHRLVQEDMERADARLIAATLNRQLVHQMVAFNFGPQAKYPRLMIGRPDELPISVIVEAIDKLGRQGLEVEESQILDRLGLTEAAKGENVRKIGGRPPPAEPKAPSAPPILPGLPGGPPLAGARPPAAGLTRHLVSLHASAPDPEYVDALTVRLAAEMSGVMAGLTGEIRRAFDEATDMQDLADRLERMQLDPKAFAEAMTRGMALAHLVGQAALVDELRHEI
ncbi:DUF935 domain-containing protein [Xanthobacter autotrophicus]|uniref:DUF935 domain-containing protein n=1 Tax=Xanthobacter TaxID=279 RepID=UPI0024AAFEF1|nr:DUF935 domain-containing protein [Xanthobacter autotrophicus]MDI4664703.1 DUF935 domain-containing protein [Xanthobacter autotrophicus]